MSDYPLGALLVNLAVTAAVVLVVIGVTFAISPRRGRHDTIDTTWGLGFAAIALTTFLLSAGNGDLVQRLLVTALTAVWGVRLAVHLHLRNRHHDEDPRYVEIQRRAKGNPQAHMFRVVYLTQGAAMWFVSLPVQAGQYGTGALGPLTFAGVALWLVGFGFEAVGDWQLSRFKADPGNRGQVMDRGLWRYTRHPNYFGDACLWWGLYLLACHHWPGMATVLAPLAMTYLLAKGTGKPLLEKHLRTNRPGYADYVARTSGFFPLPPQLPPQRPH